VADNNKRVIVEGIDFSQLLLFPKLLGTAASALQPARLIIALLMVTALITGGRVWDAIATPAVAPGGLEDGRWRDDVHGPAYQSALRNATLRFSAVTAPVVSGAATNDIDPDEALDRIESEYRTRRAALTDAEDQRELDELYQQTLRDLREVAPRGVFAATADHVIESFEQFVAGLITFQFASALDGLNDLLIRTPRILWRDHKWFAAIFGLFTMIVFAIGGGAIARMTAQQAATQQRLSVREALDFSMPRWVHALAAQALPLILALLLAAVIALMGVLMAAPALDVLGALLYGFAIILGLLIAFLLIGYILGHPMIVPAVAVENCGGADAMQRAYAYVVTRPIHLIWYWLIALIGVAIGFLVVSIIAGLALNLTADLYGTLVSNPAIPHTGDLFALTLHNPSGTPLAWHERWASAIIGFWETLVICLVAAYVISAYFSAGAVGYLLMRRAADGQAIEDIWQPGFAPGTMTPINAPDAGEAITPQTGATAG
jgi:hypothetical protein